VFTVLQVLCQFIRPSESVSRLDEETLFQLFTVTRTMTRSTPTVIERKHYSLASRHNYASFHSSYSTKLFILICFVWCLLR